MELQDSTPTDPRHQAWIDFVATGGVTIDDEGHGSKISAETLAKQLGVNRVTLYNWRESIPSFWDLVAARRNELLRRNTMTIVYRAMVQKAAKGDVAAAKLVMQQARLLEAERIDHTTNGKDLPTPILGGIASVPSNDGNTKDSGAPTPHQSGPGRNIGFQNNLDSARPDRQGAVGPDPTTDLDS